MGKAAGIWKKIKTVAKTVGNNFSKALNWANENLLRKNRKFIDPLLEVLPHGESIKKVVDMASDYVHDYNEKQGRVVDTTFGDKLSQGIGDALDVYNTDGALERAKKVNDIIRNRTGLNNKRDDVWN